jgi:hypothetical protein
MGIGGLPGGVLELAAEYASRALAQLPAEAAGLPSPSRLGAAAVLMPVALAARGGVPAPPRPDPFPVGAGAVAADLAGPPDRELFARLLESLEPDERDDPELVAARAQEVRLPVLPYRPAGDGEALVEAAPAAAAIGAGERPLAGRSVVDLSSMWAAPLATALLARLGAEVVKVEMPSRPDGLRRWGLAPGESGGASRFHDALNGGKRLLRLDLREEPDRRRFEELLAGADLLVESFSRRVMANLGYPVEELRRHRPSLRIARLRAFPPGPNQDWTAYGSGIHAIAGLGDRGGGRFAAAALSYPDPLAGLQLFAACLAQLGEQRHGAEVAVAEVSLLGAVAPLRGGSDRSRLAAEIDPAEALARGAGDLL